MLIDIASIVGFTSKCMQPYLVAPLLEVCLDKKNSSL